MDSTSFNSRTADSTIKRSIASHSKVDTCLILQYNRIALLCHDPMQLGVEPWKFETHIEYLAHNFNVISMGEMKQHLETATPFREKTVVVTFDGGYVDVLYTAKEVLEKYEVPATVFAASTGIIEEKQFWWDELENLLIAGHSHGQLRVEIDQIVRSWSLGTEYDRFHTYEDLFEILSNKTPAEQKAVMEQIVMALKSQAPERDSHRIMNAQELKELEEGELITVGGHTHSCVKLSSLPKWQQNEEISQNKNILEEVLRHNIRYFSYPFGSESGYTAETMDILENCGFSLACSNSYGTISAAGVSNRYDLPRIKVGNWNQFAFHRYLDIIFAQ